MKGKCERDRKSVGVGKAFGKQLRDRKKRYNIW